MSIDPEGPGVLLPSKREPFYKAIWGMLEEILRAPERATFARYCTEATIFRGVVLILICWLPGALLDRDPSTIFYGWAERLGTVFLGILIIYGLAKLFGGTGSYTETFFMMALVQFYSALWILAGVLLLAPLVLLMGVDSAFSAGLIFFAVICGLGFAIYMVGVSASAIAGVHEFSTGKGLVVLLLPIVLRYCFSLALAVAR